MIEWAKDYLAVKELRHSSATYCADALEVHSFQSGISDELRDDLKKQSNDFWTKASHHERDIAMLKAIIAELERLDSGERVG